jgi:hypothetical protein
MNTPVNADRFATDALTPNVASGISWAAVLAGATGAAALSLVLLLLGAGLGFSSVSPWSHSGISAATLGVSAIVWLTFTQLAASGIGGYLAGRLRVRWLAVHTDEVFFRDTAHGFLAWSIASLAMATLLTTSVTNIVSSGAHAAAAVAGGSTAAGAAAAADSDTSKKSDVNSDKLSYSIDSLFRADPKTSGTAASVDTAMISRIFVQDLAAGSMSPSDQSYVAQVVAQRTGSSQADAEQRVATLFNDLIKAKNDAIQTAKQAAEAARKATAVASLWIAFSLFVGAFVASAAATYGGRLRDR